MRSRFTLAATAALLSCFASVVVAQQSPRDAIIVSSSWLAQHLADPNLVILHVGPPDKYAASHIPGARFIELADISVSDRTGQNIPPGMARPTPIVGPKNGLSLEMPTPEQLRSQLETFGISDNSRIVVYEADKWTSPSTRVMLTLDHAGFGKNSMWLEGGLAAWIRDGHAATDVVPAPKSGKLSALSIRPAVASAEFVRDHIGKPGVVMLDARAPSDFDGIPPSRGSAGLRLGHIPGAKNVQFNDLYNQETGALKPAAELSAIFAKLGVQPRDTVITYCYIGQYGTAVLFAARSLGHPVILYDGSWNDWNMRDVSFPVENPSAKKP
jgi:thiosulfate/3-mercaptopyruvate sulfurtransferase